MNNLNLNSEEILCKIKVHKNISKKDIINNFIANILVIGGDIANDIFLILTKDTLYIEYKGHVALGYAEETRNIDKIPLNDIKSFEVTSKDFDELITLTTSNTTINFIRNNNTKNNLALDFSKKLDSIKNS